MVDRRWLERVKLIGQLFVAALLVACGRLAYEPIRPMDSAADSTIDSAVDSMIDSTANDGSLEALGSGNWQMRLTHALQPGRDRLLLVFFLADDDDLAGPGVEVLAMTYGGRPMARVPVYGRVTADADSESVVEAWFIDEAGLAAATDESIVPTLSHTPLEAPHYASLAFANVDQTAPFADGRNDSCVMCDGVTVMSLSTRPGDAIVVGAEHGVPDVMGYRLGSDYIQLNQSLTAHTSLAAFKIAAGSEESFVIRAGIQRHALIALVLRTR